MDIADVCGFAAAIATLAAFAQRSMLPMRISAILANLLFIIYGCLGPVYPVLVRHAVLLPLNVFRLSDLWRRSNSSKLGQQGDPTLIDQLLLSQAGAAHLLGLQDNRVAP